MPNPTNWPATIRELGEMAAREDLDLGAMLDRLEAEAGPIPRPPAGYTLAPGCSDHWIGTEIINGRWIITPAWDSTTNRHTLEVWMADHQPPNYSALTPSAALELAASLLQAARSLGDGK